MAKFDRPVTVLLLTKNEVSNLESAIGSFPPKTPVVVLDSYSTDGTVELARRLGASVVQREFDNWSAHQNWAVTNINFDSEWVYYTDADERMTPELWDEINKALIDSPDCSAFEMRRKDMYLGTWLRHSSFYPLWLVRLFRPSAIRWERLANPVPLVGGRVGRLQEHFVHFPFSKGTMQWFDRHIRYAELEAEEFMRERNVPLSWSALFARDHRARRRALKALYYRAPMRPLVRFLTLYIVKAGFIDGRAGLHYALMQSTYEFIIQLRVSELKRRAVGHPI